jgi:hypothetical protein
LINIVIPKKNTKNIIKLNILVLIYPYLKYRGKYNPFIKATGNNAPIILSIVIGSTLKGMPVN